MAFDEEKSGSTGRSFQQFVFDAEFAAEIAELRSAAETLRAKFEEEAVTALGANHAAWTRGGFDNLGVDVGFAQRIDTDQTGDSGADYQDWNVSGHVVAENRIGSESFRKERLGMEVLLFEVGIENHG